MEEYEDLGMYDGDPVHDSWVDYDYNENTGELEELFDEEEE